MPVEGLDLSLLVKEALSVQSNGFIETLDEAMSLLRNEKRQIGNLTIVHRLITLEPLGEALVIGDLHGDLTSLIIILQKSRFIEKMEKTEKATLIFLGDYGDRGDKSAEIYYAILKLKLAFPGQIVLLRGNHEAPKDLLGYPHDLPSQYLNKFGEDWKTAYEKTRALFAYLYNAVYVEGRYLMVHGAFLHRSEASETSPKLRKTAMRLCWKICFGATPTKAGKEFLFLRGVQGSFLARE